MFFLNFYMRSVWRCPTKRWALFYSPPFNLTTLAATCDLGQDSTRPDAKTSLQSMSPSFKLVTAWPDTLSVSLSLSPSPSLTTRLRLVRLVSVFALTVLQSKVWQVSRLQEQGLPCPAKSAKLAKEAAFHKAQRSRLINSKHAVVTSCDLCARVGWIRRPAKRLQRHSLSVNSMRCLRPHAMPTPQLLVHRPELHRCSRTIFLLHNSAGTAKLSWNEAGLLLLHYLYRKCCA